jgi:hypothetical protein
MRIVVIAPEKTQWVIGDTNASPGFIGCIFLHLCHRLVAIIPISFGNTSDDIPITPNIAVMRLRITVLPAISIIMQ